MPHLLRLALQTLALLAALPLFGAAAAWALVGSRVRRRRGSWPVSGPLCVVIPYPPGERSGGSRAIGGLLKSLAGGYGVTVVPLYELSPPRGRLRSLLADWITHALPMAVHCRIFALSGSTVRRAIPEGCPVVVEFLSGAVFLLFGRRPGGRMVLREHEPLCRRLWSERESATATGRAVLALRAAIAWLAALAVYSRVDRVVALTPEDAAFLRRAFPFIRAKVVCVPVSLDLPRAGSATATRRHEMLFLANFHHRPNVDGLLWFLREVAPRLGRGWTLHLCGLDEPLAAIQMPPHPVRVVRHGFVPDVAAEFADVSIAVAPLVSGAGVRIKNLELASLGKAIVTTPLGNHGIGLRPGVEAMVAGDAAEMAAALRTLAEDPERAVAMGRRACEWVHARSDHPQALERFRAEVFTDAVAR